MARFVACLVCVVLLASGRVHAADTSPRPIAVELCDLGHLPHDVSRMARQQLIRSFQAINVRVTVARCGERREGDAFRVSIVVLPPDSRGPASVPGIALGALSQGVGRDPIVWIFVKRIERTAQRAAVDGAIVLGHVMAHEIAHALLPVAGHSKSGLMRATWRSADLVEAVQGQLRFSAEEAAAIRERLEPPPVPSIAPVAVD